uniref:Uncharacterized protein n=1 Tax=Romanomermis culicivorax TaxID=13658 RepID=A0A915JYN3_ROMCU
MYNDLAAVNENIAVTERTVNNRRSHLPRLVSEVDELKSRLLRHNSLKDFRKRIENLVNEHAWVKVIAQERAIKEYDQILTKITTIITNANGEISSKKVLFETFISSQNAKIAEKRDLVQSLQQKININKEKLNAVEQNAQRLNDDALKVKTKRMEIRELLDLQASKSNRLARFGQHTPALLRMINEEKNFLKKPRGPLGAEISIVDESWTVAIENCLGFQILNGYICDSFHDAKILERLMKVAGCKFRPSIITSK